jgi:DnaJ domain
MRNYYDILGIDSDAPQIEIRNAYYIRARVIHPDRFDPTTQKKEWQKANEMLAELNEAYAVLRDPSKRSRYDIDMGFRRASSSTKSPQPQGTVSQQRATNSSQQHREESDKTHAREAHESRQPSRIGAVHVRFSELPEAIKQRLLNRQKGVGEHLPWRTKTLWVELGCIAIGIIWISILFFSANDHRWHGDQLFLAGASVAAMGAMSFGAVGLWRWKNSPLKGHVFITPLYFIKVRYDDVWYWGLWQLADLNTTHHYTNGVYSSTTVRFIFDDGKESLKLSSITSAQHLFDRLKQWALRRSEEARIGNWEYFAAHDDFMELHGKEPKASPKSKINFKVLAVAAAVAIVLGLSLTAVADQLNRYFDDKKSWDDATASNRVAAYRKYIDAHPSGRWVTEANQRIQQQYDTSASKYESSRSAGFDVKASDAVLHILSYAKETQQYRVRVAFERHNEIEPNLEQHLRQQFGVSNVLSIGDSFSDYKMQSRENQIFSAITSGFKELIPEDILEFTDSGPGDSAVVFLVTYKIRAGKSLYYRDADSGIPEQSRPFYPGIYIDWQFEMRTPKEPGGYRFSLQSSPAKEISYTTYSSYGADKETLYDLMATSAFQNFRGELVKRLGIQGQQTANNVMPTRSATRSQGEQTVAPTESEPIHPIINGVFASQLGSLKISTSNQKGFIFAIKLNGSSCNGTVTGKADWSDQETAGYGSIPNRSEYDDPNSAYYHQTCQLVFITSHDSIEVRETFGCTILHDTVCAFEGTYKRAGR